ncbi:hypothetical protein [Kitasatospora sp. NPDC091207]|uniref:hypothetical protein n=1 Tax=Kitasatospora sp. NPDC091207 TaxID=3364083 RepID=UPI00380E4EB1
MQLLVDVDGDRAAAAVGCDAQQPVGGEPGQHIGQRKAVGGGGSGVGVAGGRQQSLGDQFEAEALGGEEGADREDGQAPPVALGEPVEQ